MRFVNIVPVFPDNVEHMISEAERLYEQCGIDEPTLCMTLHPQGSPLEEKVELHRKVLEKMIKRFSGTPIKVGVLLQTVLGHRVDSYCEEPWQQVENITKRPAGRMCLLDKNYREYLYNMVRTIAAEHPCSILIDDDFRQINGKGLECFCPAHMTQFNEGLEHPMTADELREAVTNAEPGDPVLARFEKFRIQNLLDVAKLMRAAIDSVDPSIRCGCCTPWSEFLIEKDIALALAGNTEPFIRFCNASYSEGSAKTFPVNAYKSAILRHVMPGIREFIDEADTCPQNRYSKSAKSMHAKLVLAGLNKEAGAKLWLTNLATPDTWTERKYDAIMAKHKHFYPALRNLMKDAVPEGFTVPLPSLESIWKKWHPLKSYECLYKSDWQMYLLGHYGIPAYYDEVKKGPVYMLNREILSFFTDDEIKLMLSGRVLLDREAAVELTGRGMGEYTGIKLEEKNFWANSEVWSDGYRAIPFGSTGELKMVPVPSSEKTEVLSTLYYNKFHKDPSPRPAGAGCMVFSNPFGGRVAISTQTLSNSTVPHPRHRYQLIKLLQALLEDDLPLYVECDQNVFTRQFRLADNSTLLAVFNLNFDELENIELKGSLKYDRVEFLSPEGEWMPAPRSGDMIDIELRTFDYVLLKLS